MYMLVYLYVRVRDTRTGYLIPVRDALWDLPGWMCCSRAAAAAVAAAAGVILKIQVDILAKVL